MDRRFITILVVIIGGLGGLFWFTRDKASAPGSNSSKTTASNHVEGAGKKNVTLLEYGDFQCPACGVFYPVVKQLREKYGDDIKFQFRNFPLTQIHDKAMAAHHAAEAASLQGKFMQFHDKLYETQQEWSADSVGIEAADKFFEQYARELGLDVAKYKTDKQSTAVNNVINADIAAGQKLGVNSTPTYFLNGKQIENAVQRNIRSADDFSKLIDRAIAEAASKTSN